MRELLRRIHYLLNRRRFDAELADEMAFHHEMTRKDGGLPLGNALRLREESREAWGFTWIDRFGQDWRFAFRALRRSPGFTTAAVLVLSIGIGATVAAFSAFNMTQRPLPVRDPRSLLRFTRVSAQHSATEVSYPAFAFYREHSGTLSAVLAQTSAALSLDGGDESVAALFVSSNFFDELGATPAHGRLFTLEDGRADAPPAIVLSHDFWVRHFGSNPSVVGTTVRLSGKSVTIVGVTVAAFPGLGAEAPDLWAPLEHHADFVSGSQLLTDSSGQSDNGVRLWGRLRPGSSARAAEDELSILTAELRRQHPADFWENERLRSEPGAYTELLGAEAVFAIVGTLALLILISACGNLGSLMLARGAFRQREMSLRSAIGAGRGRLIQQLFTESLALASLGCLGGLLVGWLVLKGLMVWSAAPQWLNPAPDWRVATFALGTALLSALIFGLAPARHIVRRPAQCLKSSLTRTLLIGAQVASSCILLIVGGLLMRAFEQATSRDPGFEYQHVIVVEPSLLDHGYTTARARGFIQDLRERLRGIPGVANVSVTTTPPLGGLRVISLMHIDGRQLNVFVNQVDEHYLDTMKIQLVRGRNLVAGEEQSVVVGESLASRNWPDRDPLGQPIKIGDESMTVVGVARTARTLALGNPDTAELYRLARENDLPALALVARTSAPADTLASAFKAAANGIDPGVKPRVDLLKDRFGETVGDIRQGALAVSILGLVALSVACLGIVGLIAYTVAARTKEIGIRLSLGATPRHVMQNLVGQFAWIIAAGLAAGVLGAFGLAQLLRQELYGVSTIDPAAYLSAIGLFVVAIGAAALWPTRRALSVDPLIALRTD